jgi:thiol:disulfide interchange protein
LELLNRGNNPGRAEAKVLAAALGNPREGVLTMIGILIAVLVAALVWAVCVALHLPAIVGIVAAILVLLAGIPSGGYGLGSRFSGGGRRY